MEMRDNYSSYKEKIDHYHLTSGFMNEQYAKIFLEALDEIKSYTKTYSIGKKIVIVPLLYIYNIFLRSILFVKVHIL